MADPQKDPQEDYDTVMGSLRDAAFSAVALKNTETKGTA